ncbi:MAG: flagellar hook-associated protein FlgL [Gemmatimonadaceae bacterium]|nr:flagellar hook-associated protein FlgL [Gemmatimonadaceae bacterium]
MRVTNQLITRNSQNRLQTNLQSIDRLNEDISSGIRLRKMSDDPTSAGQVVRISSSMRALTQFQRNVDLGLSRASAEELVLNQLTDGLGRAIELGVAQASGTANAQTRLLVKTEVDQLINYAVGLGNTRLGDDYLFGGTRSGEQPFRLPPTPADGFSALTVGVTPVNPSGATSLEINDGVFMTPSHNGTEVFLSTDALEALRALSTALGNNDVPGIQAATDRITAASSQVQNVLGAQGARINELENARTNLNGMEFNLKAFRADLRDTEVDKAIAELVGKQTLYQAAMSATSRILGLSLANYL